MTVDGVYLCNNSQYPIISPHYSRHFSFFDIVAHHGIQPMVHAGNCQHKLYFMQVALRCFNNMYFLEPLKFLFSILLILTNPLPQGCFVARKRLIVTNTAKDAINACVWQKEFPIILFHKFQPTVVMFNR